MKMKEYFEQMARDGSWSSNLYEGGVPAKRYNFTTRREAVAKMLRGAGPFERMLDIGCGTGDFAPMCRALGKTYVGIDFSPTMAREGTKHVEGQGREHLFLAGSGEELPCKAGSFDLVLAIGYIEYFDDPAPSLREIRRVLKPGGTVIMQSFKWELFGSLKRRVIEPMRKMLGGSQNGMYSHLPSGWVDRKYSKGELDALMAEHGFALERHVFNNFYVIPGSMRGRFPGAYTRLSDAMTATAPSLWRFFAANYIGKYVLEGK